MYDPAHGPACGACLTAGVFLGYAARGVWACGAGGAQRAPHARGSALRAGRVDGSCGLLARRGPRRKACGERGSRRVGTLPMRTVSRQGAAHQDEVANSCIFNICHTAPGDERPRVGSYFLRQTVTRSFFKPLCTTHHTALHPRVSFSTLRARLCYDGVAYAHAYRAPGREETGWTLSRSWIK